MLEQEIRGRLLRLRKELRAAGCTVDISFTEDAASKALPREAKLRGGVVIGYRPGKFTMVISTPPGEQPCELGLEVDYDRQKRPAYTTRLTLGGP